MAHFNVLYVKENISIEDLIKKYGSEKRVSEKLEEEFLDKYCDACGEYEPRIETLCDYAGSWGDVLEATRGIKSPFENTPGNKYQVVNVEDMTDDELAKLEKRVYGFAVEARKGKRAINNYYEDGDLNYFEYIKKLQNREIKGACIFIDCHY